MSTPIRILFTEPREVIERMVRELREKGISAVWHRADDPTSLVEHLAPRPDLLIADAQHTSLPPPLLRETLEERGASIPMIVTGLGSEEAAVEYLRRGAADAVLGHHPTRIVHIVQRFVARRSLRERLERMQDEVRTSDERCRLISEQTSDCAFSFVIEPNGELRREWITGAFTRITDYTPPELDLLGWERIIHPDDLPGIEKRIRELCSGRSGTGETRIISKGGQIRWIRDETRAVSNEAAGRVVRLLGVAHDITQQRPVEQVLRISSFQQKTLSQLGQLALAGADIEVLFHEAVEQIANTLDVEIVEVVEIDGEELILRAAQGWPVEMIRASLGRPDPSTQIGHSFLQQESLIVQNLVDEHQFHRDRLLRPREAVGGITVLIRSVGTTFGVLGAHSTRRRPFTPEELHFLQEVANALALAIDRKRADAALRASEERFRELIENAHSIIYTTDLDGEFTDFNRAAEKVTGYSREEALGMAILDVIAPGHRETVRDLLRQHLAGEEVGSTELEILTKDGSYVPVELNMRVIRRDGRPVEVQGIARDTSEQQRTQERTTALLQISREVSEGHDIDLILQRTLERTAHVLPCDAVAAFAPAGASGALALLSHYGIPAELLPAAEGLGELLDEQLSDSPGHDDGIVINDARAADWLNVDPYRRLHIGSLVASPLRLSNDRRRGNLVVFNVMGGRTFEPEQVTLLDAIAGQLALAIRAVGRHTARAA